MFLDATPSLPQPVHRLGPAVESHDLGAQPLSDGAVWGANRRSSRLSHRLFRSDGVTEPEGPAPLEGSAGSGPGVAREGVGEVGGVVVVCGASGPWGWSHGPMEIHVVRCIVGVRTGPVTTEI
jgi:hypothetical protein